MENNLNIEVRKADALGLSYGKYKALTYDPDAPTKAKAKRPARVCIECGMVLIKQQRKFCSKECEKKHNNERRNDNEQCR